MNALIQDLRFAWRMLLKTPGFTAMAVVALALGIGANTAVYSAAIAFLRKPVSFPQADRIVLPLNLAPEQTIGWSGVSPADYLDWKRHSHSFEQFAAWRFYDVNLTGIGDPERLSGVLITSNFFDAVGVSPAMGRPFLPQEEEAGHDHEAIISYGLWQRRFGADPNIVGKTVQLSGASYDMVGVMGKEDTFPQGVEVWRPLSLSPAEQTLRTDHYIMPITRLKPGVTIGQAAAEIKTIEARLERQFPNTETGWNVKMVPVAMFVSGDLSMQYSLMLIWAVLFVLLIACANVANLLFARGAGRQKEIAVRRAMGASRLRIVRQLLTESVLLGCGGAGLGLMLGQWGIEAIRYYMPPEVDKYLPMWKHVRLEADVFWYTVGIALLAGLVSGLAPAFHSSRSDVHEELKEGGRGTTAGRNRQRLRTVFVVAEVALSLILLVGAGLMVKGVNSLLVVNPKLDAQHVLTMVVSLPESKYKTARQKAAFFDEALRQLGTIPGVSAVGVATNLPFGFYGYDTKVSIQGKVFQPGEFRQGSVQKVSAGYFSAMRIPLRQGRLLADTDGAEQPPVVVISRSFAHRYFAGENPVGKFIKPGDDAKTPWVKVVGVVGDIRYDVLGSKETPPIYFPYQQANQGFCPLVLYTEGSPMAFAAAVRSQIAKVDPDQPISEMMTLQKEMDNHLIGFEYVAVMLTVMGIMALVLASVGVYGVMAYSVAERTHELGVRLALGAERRDLLALVMRRGFVMPFVGLLIGVPVAWVMAQGLAGLLFGVSSTDVPTFSGISVLMGATTLLACYVPARRAMRVDPMEALRHE
jgi:putative ABC transport system permease protein